MKHVKFTTCQAHRMMVSTGKQVQIEDFNNNSQEQVPVARHETFVASIFHPHWPLSDQWCIRT